jgi:hypothetical protein
MLSATKHAKEIWMFCAKQWILVIVAFQHLWVVVVELTMLKLGLNHNNASRVFLPVSKSLRI